MTIAAGMIVMPAAKTFVVFLVISMNELMMASHPLLYLAVTSRSVGADLRVVRLFASALLVLRRVSLLDLPRSIQTGLLPSLGSGPRGDGALLSVRGRGQSKRDESAERSREDRDAPRHRTYFC